MSDDSIVDEIHHVRAELSEQFGGDIRALGRYLRELDAASGVPTITRPPKPVRIPILNRKRSESGHYAENADGKVRDVSTAQ